MQQQGINLQRRRTYLTSLIDLRGNLRKNSVEDICEKPEPQIIETIDGAFTDRRRMDYYSGVFSFVYGIKMLYEYPHLADVMGSPMDAILMGFPIAILSIATFAVFDSFKCSVLQDNFRKTVHLN